MDCIFCNIAGGEIPSTPVYRDDEIFAIRDIEPQAPVHLLVMPTRHFADIGEIEQAGERELIAHLFSVAARLGRETGGGFRLVVNTGSEGGQTVDHAHVHMLAGRLMEWPPG